MKRALVLGSQIAGLRGVEHDTLAMESMLKKRGFDKVDRRVGKEATRDGMLAGYEELIAASGPDDVAVVYYSGHGLYAQIPGESASWQCIAPTDMLEGTPADFRGITAWELSVLQARLTEQTRNVTVILDCCHSSLMSKDAAARDAVPRSLPHPVEHGFAAHLAKLREKYGDAMDRPDPLGNPHAVRLVACAQIESAYEYPAASGEFRGAFTEALLAVLAEAGGAEVSWAAIEDSIRARVLRLFAAQRPDIEGPTRRRLFSLVEENDRGITAVRAHGRKLELPVGRLTGVSQGDIYGVMPAGSTSYSDALAIAELEVAEAQPFVSAMRVSAWHNGHTVLPATAVAIPRCKTAPKRAIAIAAPEGERAALAAALADAPTLRVAEGDEPALATLRLSDGSLTLEDDREPLFPAATYPAGLATVVQRAKNLAASQAIRELEGAQGVHASEVEIEIGLVENGAKRPLRDYRASLGLKDRFYIQVKNTGQRQLYAHIFNVGLQGNVSLLTKLLLPGGVPLFPGAPLVLGRRADGTLRGIGIAWPEGLPRDIPRLDEYFVFVTSVSTNLAVLETPPPGVIPRGASKLQALLAQVHNGEPRDPRLDAEDDGFLVQRLSYLLHPRDAALGGVAFQIDENPAGQRALTEPSAWRPRALAGAAPAPAAPAPDAIAIRIADLVVNANRALFSADVRVDALICTRAAPDRSGHATWTQKFQNIKDEEHLPLKNGLLYLGPVRDFVDITLFVSRDTDGSLELAKLFAERANSPELEDAATALLVAAGATAAPWVAAVGASAVLARMAYELLLGAAGKTIGLFRTSFLRSERFGCGRHPIEGLYRAQDFSFSLLIEPAELQPAG